ncbi:MAG: flagellar assembly protein FliW [Desulfomonilia bacterium]
MQTVRFGTIPIQEDKVITFPKGILGFARNKKYVLFPHSEKSPFFWLQSVEDGELAFVVMNPHLVKPDYSIDLEQETLQELGSEKTEDLELLCIVTIPRGRPEDMTINLLGPLIINAHTRSAVQVIADSEKHSHRHPIISGKT